MTTEFNTLKSITLKNLGLDIPTGGGDYLNKTIALVVGKAKGYAIKITQFGESYALQGEFMAANSMSGEVFEAGVIYLPNEFAESIANTLDKNPGSEVFIGTEAAPLEIVVAASAKAARGYTFIVREASTPKVVNARAAMASMLSTTLKELPVTEPVKALESAPKGKKSA